MLNNFIYAQSKAMFEERLHEIPNDAIVFIEDTKEIWTHGHYFDCSTLDPSIIPNLQTEIAELKTSVIEKKIVGEFVTAEAQAITGGDFVYALPDQADGYEDDVLLSRDSVKTVNGNKIYGSGDISTVHYGVCNSEETTSLKVVTVSTLTNIVNGTKIVVKFTNGGIAPPSTLIVNGKSSNIKYGTDSMLLTNAFKANAIVEFTYSDNIWYITGGYQYDPYINGLKGGCNLDRNSITNYGVCNTAANTAAKTVTVGGNFSLVSGAQVVIKFTKGNTADNCTLNVNNTGAKNILMNDYIKNMSIPLYTVLTFVYDGTNWLITGSSNMLTSGNTTSGYTLQIINSETAGLGIANGQSIPDTADGALCIVAETSNNAINCYSGDVVLRDGFFDGAYVHNTRVLTGNAVLNKYDSLVLYDSANSATITMPNNPADGRIITFIKRSSSGKITFSSSTANLNAPQDDVSNKSSVTISSVGVRKLYYINSRWYIFLQ